MNFSPQIISVKFLKLRPSNGKLNSFPNVLCPVTELRTEIVIADF